jgi:hypothetical protein
MVIETVAFVEFFFFFRFIMKVVVLVVVVMSSSSQSLLVCRLCNVLQLCMLQSF